MGSSLGSVSTPGKEEGNFECHRTRMPSPWHCWLLRNLISPHNRGSVSPCPETVLPSKQGPRSVLDLRGKLGKRDSPGDPEDTHGPSHHAPPTPHRDGPPCAVCGTKLSRLFSICSTKAETAVRFKPKPRICFPTGGLKRGKVHMRARWPEITVTCAT